jgi:cytochrome c-type biogenesis protein CcmH/NrfG
VADQQAILAKDPNNAAAYFALGTLSYFQGSVEQAIQHFERSSELDPRNPDPHLSLGRIYAIQRDYERAWKHARAAEVLGSRDLVELLDRYPQKT